MADVENQQESSFPVKRKPDLFCQDQDNVANKAQKLNPSSIPAADSESKDGEINGSGVENLNSSTDEKIGSESSVSLEKAAGSELELEKDVNGVAGDLGAEEEQEGGNEEEEEEEDDEDEDEDEEEEEEDDLIEAEINRKGKGISREDKGKGKMIEVDESDEDDDSDDEDGGDEYDESDLSDDPLAEVDLDNILPSRTRRRSIQPGVYISNDRVGNVEADDSSDDSDA
uniref:Histone chaperone domain-containing protein n=1 Tax=Noccaea caerulescens TaxID=107243 RepID=A0A1J3D8D0_NOCCA